MAMFSTTVFTERRRGWDWQLLFTWGTRRSSLELGLEPWYVQLRNLHSSSQIKLLLSPSLVICEVGTSF